MKTRGREWDKRPCHLSRLAVIAVQLARDALSPSEHGRQARARRPEPGRTLLHCGWFSGRVARLALLVRVLLVAYCGVWSFGHVCYLGGCVCVCVCVYVLSACALCVCVSAILLHFFQSFVSLSLFLFLSLSFSFSLSLFLRLSVLYIIIPCSRVSVTM